MKNLKKKLSRKEGFTLIEMLIVVAIIAILIAISIPLIGNALETARENTDAANERSFKAEMVIAYLTEVTIGSGTDKFAANAATDTTYKYVYDAAAGKLLSVAEGGTVTPYGQSTPAGSHDNDIKGKILYGYMDDKGEVHMVWAVKGTTSPSTGTVDTIGSKIADTSGN